ncbi:hypothetical protein ABH968_004086 [Lysinibacillus sp. RC79]
MRDQLVKAIQQAKRSVIIHNVFAVTSVYRKVSEVV